MKPSGPDDAIEADCGHRRRIRNTAVMRGHGLLANPRSGRLSQRTMSYAEQSASSKTDMSRKIILLEADEIPPRFLRDAIPRALLPHILGSVRRR